VRESLVLLKNEHSTLPLSPRARILVAGEGANQIGMQAGGWTVDWQGDHNRNADFPGATSIFEGIRATMAAAGGIATLSPDGHFTQRPDAAIVVFGEHPYAEYEGDRETLDFSSRDLRTLSLLRALRARGIPTISIFLSGRPLWVNPELNASDAFIAAWLPGSEGEGIADVLFRGSNDQPRFDFKGRLSFPWPRTAIPVIYDDTDQTAGALFDRGYGLGYTQAGPVARLSEDPQIPPDRGDADSLFQSGHATAPWSLFVADSLAQVRVTSAEQASPTGALRVALSESQLTAAWSSRGQADFWIGGRPIDLRAAALRGDVVQARFRVDKPPAGTVRVGVRCSATSQAAETGCGMAGGAMLDATQALSSASRGAWATLSVPLVCFARAPGLSIVAAPFALRTEGELAINFTDIRLAHADVQQCRLGVQAK
jgi:beta-glucosidase